MPLGSSQDFVKGIDFTGLSSQTAAEHNQLIDLGTPFEVTSAVGIGLVITTTDTAANTPDVPDPTASADYNKWARYLWNRRPFAGETDKSCKLYSWNDDATSDATYLKWELSDPASNTTIGGGAGTPLQTAIDSINTTSTNASASASTAYSAAVSLANAVYGGVGSIPTSGTDLSTQVSDNATGIATNVTDITSINTAIGGTDGLTGTGGINGQISTLQSQLNDLTISSKNVSTLNPSPIAGAMIRTKSDSSAVEWFDPTDTTNEIIGFTQTGPQTFAGNATTAVTLTSPPTVQPGTYLIEAFMSVNFGTSNKSIYFTFSIGSVTITSNKVSSGSTAAPSSHTLFALGVITVTAAMGASAITANAVVTGGSIDADSDNFFQFVIRRISAKQS